MLVFLWMCIWHFSFKWVKAFRRGVVKLIKSANQLFTWVILNFQFFVSLNPFICGWILDPSIANLHRLKITAPFEESLPWKTWRLFSISSLPVDKLRAAFQGHVVMINLLRQSWYHFIACDVGLYVYILDLLWISADVIVGCSYSLWLLIAFFTWGAWNQLLLPKIGYLRICPLTRYFEIIAS